MFKLERSGQSPGIQPASVQGWFITYRQEGLRELLVSRVNGRAPTTELITEEVFEELRSLRRANKSSKS